MATTALRGTPVSTSGELPDVGDHAPEFTLTSTSLADVSSEGLVGSRVVLNIFPSVDTGVCAASVRRFNELAGSLDNTTVVNVSLDLPFALSRFCGAEGIENVTSASAFRSTFGDDYGVRMVDFYIESIDIPENDPIRQQYEQGNVEVAVLETQGENWSKLQSAKILSDLANNPGAGGIAAAGAAVGFGAAAGSAVCIVRQRHTAAHGWRNARAGSADAFAACAVQGLWASHHGGGGRPGAPGRGDGQQRCPAD